MATSMLITGGRVATPEGLRDGWSVRIAGDRIAEVGPAPVQFAGETLRLTGQIVSPGLIDTHIHGGLEHDAMDATPAALQAIARHLARHGVTAWLPTTVACDAASLDRILGAVAEAMRAPGDGAVPLGAHLESNFLAPKFKGAQPPECLRTPDDAAELLAVIARHRAVIRVLTLAPELAGAPALIRTLIGWGLAVSIGHSDATYDQVLAGVEAGARRVTHLCNAQRGFHHREPGVLGAALVTDSLYSEVIADLIHVHPAGLQIARRCKGPERLMLVSDALRGTGLPPGTYELGGQTTLLDGTVARLQDGTIAGSTITLERAIANMIDHAGSAPDEAIAMASAVPAASLGLADRGRLEAGARADLAIFDPSWRCQATMIGGRWVHDMRWQEVASP